jgi:hypothetical protein
MEIDFYGRKGINKGVFTRTLKSGKKVYWSTLGFEATKIKCLY